MSPNSEPSSDDKIPSFFLDDDKTGKNNLDFQNIADETDINETLSNTHTTKAPRITSGIHCNWCWDCSCLHILWCING